MKSKDLNNAPEPDVPEDKPGLGQSDAAPASAPPSPEEVLKAEIAAKDKLARDYFDQLLRLKAEFENFRKRVDRERPDLIRYGKSGVLAKLLPLYDVLETAHEATAKRQSGKEGKGAPSESFESLARGLDLIFREFEKLLQSEGIRPMEAEGRPCHHDWHDVVGTTERTDLAEGTVIEVLQKGYLLDDNVLRHAKVRISKKPADESK